MNLHLKSNLFFSLIRSSALDIVLIALTWQAVFVKYLSGTLHLSTPFFLGSTVWVIYCFDHHIDLFTKSLKNDSVPSYYHFLQNPRWFYVIGVFALIILFFTFFYLPKYILFQGMALSFACGFYLFWLYRSKIKPFLIKAFFISLFFTLGVTIGMWSLSFTFQLYLWGFFSVCFLNFCALEFYSLNKQHKITFQRRQLFQKTLLFAAFMMFLVGFYYSLFFYLSAYLFSVAGLLWLSSQSLSFLDKSFMIDWVLLFFGLLVLIF